MLLDLPAELISKILQECYFHLYLIPEMLGSINRTLRDLVVSMPELWQYIAYSDDNDLPQVQRYLERSQNLPFHLHLDIFFPAYDFASLASLTRLLQPHTQRMQSLRITPQLFHNPRPQRGDTVYGPFQLLHAVGQAPFSVLEVLEFELSSVDYLQRKTFNGLVVMPRLRELTINCEIDLTAASEMVGVQILKCDLSLAGYHPFPDLKYLERFPALDTLDLVLPDLPHEPLGVSTTLAAWPPLMTFQLVLPSLTELNISIPNVLPLRLFGCPNLVTFCLKGGSGPHASSYSRNLWLFLARHSTTLQNVHMDWKLALDHSNTGQLPQDPPRNPFPLLHRLTGNLRQADDFFNTIQGVSLRCVSLAVGKGTSVTQLFAFFDVASENLESITLAFRGDQASIQRFYAPRFRFPQLRTFVSQSTHGDAVVAATLEAPVLETLVLYGTRNHVTRLHDQWPDPPLRLESLRILTIKRISDILCRLHTPNIENLLVEPFSTHLGTDYRKSLRQFVERHSTSLRSIQLFHPIVVLADVADITSQVVFSNLLSATLVTGEALGAVSSAPKLQSLAIFPPVSDKHSHQSLLGFCTAEFLTLRSAELEYVGLSSILNSLRNITTLHIHLDPDPRHPSLSREAALVLAGLMIVSYGESGEKVFRFPKLRSIRLTYQTAEELKQIGNLPRTRGGYAWDHDKDDPLPSEWVDLPPFDFPTRDSDWSGSEVSKDEEVGLDSFGGGAQGESGDEEDFPALVLAASGELGITEVEADGVEGSESNAGGKGESRAEGGEEEAEDDDEEHEGEPGDEGQEDDSAGDEDETERSATETRRRRRRQWYRRKDLPDITDSSYAPSTASDENPDTDIPFGLYFGILRAIILSRKNEPGCAEIEEIQIIRGRGYETGGFYELEGSRRAAWLARHVEHFSIDESR